MTCLGVLKILREHRLELILREDLEIRVARKIIQEGTDSY